MNRDGNFNDEANLIPSDLSDTIRNVYGPAGLTASGAAREAESSEYRACRFRLNNRTVAFRVAKTTPTKIGQFVTLWKRPATGGVIAPLDISDDVAFVVVSVFDATHRGQFVFDRTTLAAKGIISVGGKGGKRAIRVYPPWTKPVARDAVRTQAWQIKHFLPLAGDGTADPELVRKFFR